MTSPLAPGPPLRIQARELLPLARQGNRHAQKAWASYVRWTYATPGTAHRRTLRRAFQRQAARAHAVEVGR